MHALMVGEKLRLKKNVEIVSFRLTAEEFKVAEISLGLQRIDQFNANTIGISKIISRYISVFILTSFFSLIS